METKIIIKYSLNLNPQEFGKLKSDLVNLIKLEPTEEMKKEAKDYKIKITEKDIYVFKDGTNEFRYIAEFCGRKNGERKYIDSIHHNEIKTLISSD